MKRKRTFSVIVTVLTLFLIGWRMWPHTFRMITSTDDTAFHTISIHVSEMGISDGTPVVEFYQLMIDDPEDEHYTAVMSILEGTGYRSDFRNIIPWKDSSFGSDSNRNISHSAMVILTWENGNSCELFFVDDRLVGLSKDQQNGFTRYHPTDRSTLDQITTYTIEHGTLQK